MNKFLTLKFIFPARRYANLIAISALFSISVKGYSQTQIDAHTIDFFIGEWDVTVVDIEGKVTEKARTAGRHILENTALQSDYYGINPQTGKSYFRGSTIRTFVASEQIWVVHWMMSNLKGYTYLEEKWVDGELHAKGHGQDAHGDFLEKYRYYDISLISYSFEMQRSKDNGKTWHFFNRIYAKRRDRRAP